MNKKNNTNQNPNSLYLLTNIENYKLNLVNSPSEIIRKKNSLCIEYLNFISDNISSQKNYLNKFIIIRGLDTISNVFNTILYYTKNLDLSFYHSQKAFYFYVEFIEQIMNDEHIFLNISSRDATLFVYKKTIFDINKSFQKNIGKEKEKEKEIIQKETFDILLLYKNIIKLILFFFTENNNESFKKENLKKTVEIIENFIDKINDCKLSKKNLEILISFLEYNNNHINTYNFKLENYKIILDIFLKKLFKTKIDIHKKLKDNINHYDTLKNTIGLNNESFVNYFFL
jgi:hypothetical protein